MRLLRKFKKYSNVSAEGALGGYHTFDVQRSLNIGVVLFIVTYFHSALSPTVELGSQWPAPGIEPLNAFEIPLLNTVLLLTSASSLTYAHHALINGNRKSCLIGFIVTLALAVTFTGFQALEYIEAPFTISDGAFGSTFFFSTGFH
ncbi:hypothetical protein CROQUDRAFT_675247 [Cronartium quercuum f. sp. fusiforme G11]|uniref:Cytochrome c oxidase subunit 3 n=1 Tax=Cronartium quercuum f. sp. fusiforme G11 TaxID=708437 RepID=A0A9P6T624_9BASI|nr:hypothetical protein CROQUDRAFT_675247 [Cronartium quercuum f. sp. fusiforme G11]